MTLEQSQQIVEKYLENGIRITCGYVLSKEESDPIEIPLLNVKPEKIEQMEGQVTLFLIPKNTGNLSVYNMVKAEAEKFNSAKELEKLTDVLFRADKQLVRLVTKDADVAIAFIPVFKLYANS